MMSMITWPDVPDCVISGHTTQAEGGGHGCVGRVGESGPEADEGSDAAHVHQRLFQLVVEVAWRVMRRVDDAFACLRENKFEALTYGNSQRLKE